MKGKLFLLFVISIIALGVLYPGARNAVPAAAGDPNPQSTGLKPESGATDSGQFPNEFISLKLPEAPGNLSPQERLQWYERESSRAFSEAARLLEPQKERGLVKSFVFLPDSYGIKLEAAPQVVDELYQQGLVGMSRPIAEGERLPGEPGAEWSTPLMVEVQEAHLEAEVEARLEEKTFISEGLPEANLMEAAPIVMQPENLQTSQPGAPQITPPMNAGDFQVSLFQDRIWGFSITASTSLTLIVEQSGLKVAEKIVTSDEYRYYNAYLDNNNFLLPGNIVRVQETGQSETSLVIPDLRAYVNASTNGITGQAPAGSTLHLYWNGFWLDRVAQIDGSFSADFSSLTDILYNQYGSLYYADPDTNNQVYVGLNSPELWNYYGFNEVGGYSGAHTVTRPAFSVSLYNETGGLKGTANTTSNYYNGRFYVRFSDGIVEEPGWFEGFDRHQ